MKTKMILFVLVVIAISAGIVWIPARHLSAVASGGRKALYYTCAMHPWVRESKPGQCPVCGMELTPIYANESGMADTNANADSGMVTLEPESISTINVQTDLVERRPVRHMLHLSGEIVGNSWTAAWFEFTAYERDLQWLKVGQTFNVSVSSAPDKIYHAQIKLHGVKPFADANFDMMSGSTTVRAQILNPPVEPGDFGKNKLFNGLHAEAHVVAETENVLTVPRSAIISRGTGTMVYVDKGDGHYAPRAVLLGRVGDEYTEVTAGLKEGEKVVTTGNVLIDSEAQLTTGE
jgi:multidrug efflux pump subunit AcrA (membrane-fusion protein)